jgi:hypothetical protein
MPRHFTPGEANDALGEIRPLVERLVAHRREQQRLEGERGRLKEKIAGNGGGIDAQTLADLDEAEQQERVGVARCVNAIHEHGAIVKDLDQGLVDFPALRRGEEILLCWHLGEPEVAHWHGLEEGFTGRRPLDDVDDD